MTQERRRHTLSRSARIKSRKQFVRVLRHRCRLSDRWMTLYAVASESGYSRLGISAGKRIGGAVQRNRRKRLVREAFRHIRDELPAGLDLIVIPKPGPEPTVSDLQQSLRDLAARLADKTR